MKTHSALLGIHRPPVNSPHKGYWCGVLMFSLICAWTDGWISNRNAGVLRRHPAHYDVTVSTSKTFAQYGLIKASVNLNTCFVCICVNVFCCLYSYVDGLVQDRRNFIANANPSMWYVYVRACECVSYISTYIYIYIHVFMNYSILVPIGNDYDHRLIKTCCAYPIVHQSHIPQCTIL